MTEQAVPQLGWLYVYLTRACNCRCLHCWLEAEPGRAETTITVSDILGLVRQALPLGLNSVRLTGGEPLLFPSIDNLIRGLAELGVSVQMETNAMELDSDLARLLKDVNGCPGVSLDGEPDYHDTMRGIAGSYRRTLAGLRHLRDHGVSTHIVMALRRQNVSQIPHIVQVAREVGVLHVKINPIVRVGRAAGLDDLLTVEELLELNGEFSVAPRDGVDVRFDLPPAFWPLSALKRVGYCRYLNTVSLLSDGKVAICGLGFEYERWRLGSVGDDICTIWREHPVLEEIRREIPANLEGVCGQCLLVRTCAGGCRAFSLMESNKITAANVRCQELYERGLFPISRLRSQAAGAGQ